jgi:hypothetical protein
MKKHSIFLKLLKEPLIHFVLIGAGLFLLFAQLNSEEEVDTSKQIIINKAKLNMLSSAFMKDNGREPTDKEMAELLEKSIREKILYKEAMAIGLDKDDIVIQHRLAEKMKYLFEDITVVEDPTDEILKVYFQENIEKFKDKDGNIPKFDDIKYKLTNKWIADKQKKENKAFYDNLKSQYKIINVTS